MAKGNMFLGMSRGSVGDVTFYRNQGQQCARARNRAPHNPKTYAQIVQRMILATASKAYSRMKSITDHSFQNVQYGTQSQSYFLKKAMDRIREFVANELANFPATSQDPFAWVGLARPDSYNEAGYGLQISEGTIPSVSATYATQGEGEDADTVLDHFGALIAEASEENPAANKEVLRAIGARLGDQITAVAVLANGEFAKSRYVIKADATDSELNETWPTTNEIDGGPFDENDTIVNPSVYIVANGTKLQVTSKTSEVAAAAIIISRKEGNNWQRSTQYLMPAAAVENVPGIIALWELPGATIEGESPYFLNNADD